MNIGTAKKVGVKLIEVAPRDGFQSVAELIAPADKLAIIQSLQRAGLRHIEVGAFVHPKAIAQMADIQQILDGLAQQTAALECEQIVLVPNEKGAQRAALAGCKSINFVFSVSEAHNQSNVRKTVEESLEELKKVIDVVDAHPQMTLRVSLATSFDCPFTAKVDSQRCLKLFDRVLALAPDAQIALCDTTGRAHPMHVSELFNQASTRALSEEQLIFHCHDTYGFAIANIAAAYAEGVRVFDTAVAGFGGCPFAPGASGNVATEDVVYFFEQAGIDTGVNWELLKEAITLAEHIKGAQLGGHLRLLKNIV